MAKVHIASAGAPLSDGLLQLQNGDAMDATLRPVTDQANTASPLELSTGLVSVSSTLQIATNDLQYIDAEDTGGNNRFTVSRSSGSQVVNVDFASNPTLGTDQVGAIRTYQDGVSLSDSISFMKNGYVGIGNKINATGFNQKLRIIGQQDGSIGIYRNQESEFPAKLEFMKSRGTYDVPTIVNTNDLLGSVSYFGFNGSNYSPAATIASVALSTSTAVEGDLRFTVYNNTGGIFYTMRATKEGVGIGDALSYIPSARLQVRGSGSTAGSTAFLVQNSSGNQIIMARDDRYVEVGAMGFLTNSTYTTQPFLVGGLIAPVASAIVEVSSTTKGFLPPRMTTAQKTAIASPAAGLVVYDTTLNKLCVYTTAWETITSV